MKNRATKMRLLREPSQEEEDAANKLEAKDQSSNCKQQDRMRDNQQLAWPQDQVINAKGSAKARRRGDNDNNTSNNNNNRNNQRLSRMLVILFGSLQILISCCLLANSFSLQTTAKPQFNSTEILMDFGNSSSETSTASSLELETTTKTEAATTIVPFITTTVEPSSSSMAVEMTEELEIEEPEEPKEGGRRVTSELLVGTFDEASEKLVGKLKPSTSFTDEDNLTNDEEPTTKLPTVGNSTDEPEAEHLNAQTADQIHLEEAMKTWSLWKATADELIELFSKKMLPLIVEQGYEVDAGTVSGLLQVFNGIRALKPWALKLLDASTKLSPGILLGTQSDFGDYDECLNIRVDDPSGLVDRSVEQELDPSTGLPTSTLVGRYCLADVEFPKPPRERLPERNQQLQTDFKPIELRRPLLNFSETAAFKDTIFVETGNFFHMLYVDPLRVSVCLTNKIDPDSFAKVLNKLLEEFRVSINFNGRCVTKYDKIVWTLQQKVSAYVILVACSLLILCTVLDLLHSKLAKLPLPERFTKGQLSLQSSLERYRPLFTSFSVIRNTKRLFRPQSSKLALDHATTGKDGGYSSAESSTESSPSVDRRSLASSAANLIHDPQANKTIAAQGLNWQFTDGATKLVDRRPVPPNNMLCLHGIRVITMTWMIVNHTYLFGGFFVLWAYRRLIDIAEWPKSLSFQLVLNGWLTVETYFFLGATIIVISVMPAMRANRFSYWAYVLHRLIRLLPAYVGLVCLNFLWPLISSGPVWLVKGKSFIQTPCENYLWTNFLFINNWFWPEKQLYLVAPLIVYLLYRRPKFGHSLNIIVAILASCFSGFVIYANKLMPTTLINKLEFDSIKQQLSYSYFATYQHMGPYCLGIFTGYMLHKQPQIRLPKHITCLLWLLLPPLSFTTLLLTYLWNGAYDDLELINPSPLVSAFYVAIHRTIWTALVAWLVFACATGRAKILTSFLSHSMFIPLSRLSFSIYLVHLPVIMFRALNLRHTIEWTDGNILWEACGNFLVSIMVGYFLNVTFESPIINLEQVIFNRRRVFSSPDRNRESCTIKNDISISGPDSGHGSKLRPQIAQFQNDSDDNKSTKSSKSNGNSTTSGSSASDQQPQNSAQTLESSIQYTDSSMSQLDFGKKSPSSHLLRQSLKGTTNYLTNSREEAVDEEIDELDLSGGSRQQQMAPSGRIMGAAHRQQFNQYRNDGYPWLGDREFTGQHLALVRPQYATLARMNHLERRVQHTNGSGPRDRPTRSTLGRELSDLDTSSSSSTHGRQYLTPELRRQPLRRQGRYNTLTGADQRELSRQLRSNARSQRLILNRFGELDVGVGNQDWLIYPGALLPRLDSSNLRIQPEQIYRRVDSILEEER